MNFSKHILSSLISAAGRGTRRRHRAAACIFLVMTAAASLTYFQPGRAQAQQAPTTLHGATALDRLKQDGQYDSLQAALEQARFSVSRREQTPLGRTAWHAPNRWAGYDAYITEGGVSIAVNNETYVSLHLQRFGYGQTLQAVGPGQVSGDKQMINIERAGGLREWFVNGTDGLEHGFTLSEPPGARQQGVPLRLMLQVSQGWQAVASEDDQLVTLRGAQAAVEYGKLVVRDQLGRNIAARLTVADEQVVIEVEDHEATYPLTIDPIFTLQQKLLAADGAANDLFGSAVALSGNTAAIGAQQDDVTGADQGTVYVFVRNGATWHQQARLNAADGAANDYFGSAVALSGDTLVVGATCDDFGLTENQGSVYVFTRNGTVWTQQQKLIANDGAAEDRFGVALALDGDTLVVGAHADDVGINANQGSAYVFTRNAVTQPVWTQQQKLTANDGVAQAAFGYALALDQETLVIGAPSDTIGANIFQGSAYVFTRNGTGWTLQQKLMAADGAARDQFGYAVALGGDTVLLGAPNDDLGVQANQGSAYVFVRNGTSWAQQQQLTASDGAADDEFGYAVALNGELMLIGALFDDIGTNNEPGSAYLFARNNVNWMQQRKLFAADGRNRDILGVAVALERGTVLLGASMADAKATDQGAVYAFVVRDTQHVEQQRLVADDAADGDQFGVAVALSGDTLAVGAYSDDFGEATNQGSVYVFTRNGTAWTLQQKLMANDAAQSDEFGAAVALSGDLLVVGAPHAANVFTDYQGSAYVFTRVGTVWTQHQKLRANSSPVYDRFGEAVALSGNTIAVGAPSDRVGMNTRQGSVYVFAREGAGWALQQQVRANDGAADNYFGNDIALSGDTLIVGAEASKVGANNLQGAAYVFMRVGTFWRQQQKLLANDGAEGDRFGSSVALDEDTVVIGAPSKSIGGNGGFGAAYIFERNGTVWTQQQRLTANDGEAFGIAVALSGGTALIGAVLSDVGDNVNQGAAYAFTRAGTVWTQQQKLIASDGTDFDDFGRSVASTGDTLVVGANTYGPDINSYRGAVYVFASTACPTITLEPDALPDGASGASYQQMVTATGGARQYQFALVSGALPPGLTLSRDGLLSGTPMTAGSYRFTLNAINAGSLCAGSREYTLTITSECPALTINPPTLPNGAAGAAYNQTLTATGGTATYYFALAAGALPPGLSLSANGSLSGTPTQAGIYNFTIAAESNGCTGAQAYTLGIRSATVAIVSAASYKAEAAPESIAAVFGVQMAEQTEVATTLPLPTELAGVSVSVRDSQGVERLAPLFFVSPGQINLQIPPGTAPGAATVSLSSGASGRITIAHIAPGLLTANADGQGAPAGVYLFMRNGVPNYAPAARLVGNRFVPEPLRFDSTSDQVFLVLYGTGLRFGQEVTAKIGPVDVNVSFVGAAPGFAGLDQVNIQVPFALRGRGELEVVLYVDRAPANTVLINVR